MGLHSYGSVLCRLSQTVRRNAVADAAARAHNTPIRDVAFQRLRERGQFEDPTLVRAMPGPGERHIDPVAVRRDGDAVQAGVVQSTGRDGNPPGRRDRAVLRHAPIALWPRLARKNRNPGLELYCSPN